MPKKKSRLKRSKRKRYLRYDKFKPTIGDWIVGWAGYLGSKRYAKKKLKLNDKEASRYAMYVNFIAPKLERMKVEKIAEKAEMIIQKREAEERKKELHRRMKYARGR